MPEVTLLRPWWLALAPLGLALIVWAWRRGDIAGPWRGHCDPGLLARLVVRRSARRPALAPVLGGAVVVIAAAALAGPSWSRVEQPVFRSDRATVVVLDLSRSMDATDLAPSRLARARFKIADILARSRDGQAGLVVYAGDAYVVAPLTDDVATLTNLLPALATDLMPVQGSRADLGLERAGALLDGAGARRAQVILLSDGTDDPRAVDAARTLASAGHRVSVLAVGSARGAPVPLAGGGFLTDAQGNIVIPGLDAEGLARVARSGGGALAPLTSDDSDLRVIATGAGAPVDARGAASRLTARWEDRGPWLVLALLPLAALGFRRGWLMAFAVLALPPAPVLAAGLESLWLRADQRAAAALARGEDAEAARAAPSPLWQGPARYRTGEFDAAARAFQALPGADARYNQGNALARAGRLQDALTAYDRALDEQPGHDDAAFNRALVERLLRGSEGGSPPDGDGDGDGERQPGQDRRPGADSRSGDGASDRTADGAQADPDREAGRSGQQADGRGAQTDAREPPGDADDPGQAQRSAGHREGVEPADGEPGGTPRDEADGDAEARQAMDQWMRRIPDDPGGLLRRKFALEHRRRGGGAAAESAW